MHRLPLYASWLLAGVVTAVTIRYSSFTAWVADPASYVSAGHQWATGELFSPNPLHLWSPPLSIGVPLGSRDGPIAGTYVSAYPLGLPVLLATGELIDRELGAYLVVPIFAGILVLATFAVARSIMGDWSALLAASLVAANPIVLAFAVGPMSDVPATALTMLAIAMSVRTSLTAAAAAGTSMALAVMTRPIVAPLAIVPLALVLLRAAPSLFAWREWHWKHAMVFVGTASIGPAMLAWSQSVLYGGALTPAYGQFETFFSGERILTNAGVYIRNLATLLSPLVFFGLATAVPLHYIRAGRTPFALRTIVSLIAIVSINYASYLPYLTYDDVGFTRFMLPAQAALLVLLASSVNDAVAAWPLGWKPAMLVCFVPVVIVMYEGSKSFNLFRDTYGQQSQARLMGRYLNEVLPPNAAVVSLMHSGAVAHYTGREIVRYDLMPRGRDAELLIDRLTARGYRPVFVLDQQNDGGYFKIALQNTRYARMEWPARANFMMPGSSTVWYADDIDRGRSPHDSAPLDLVRANQK